MIDDKNKILQILKSRTGKIDVDLLIDSVICDLKKEILSVEDEVLLNLIFSENPSQKNLDKCLENYDIEVVGGHKALMLAYFMKMHPELKFSSYVKPRLHGLLQFYRFQNMKLISHFVKICTQLKKSNIYFLIFKGGAMKHLRPEYPRVMGDIDILVREVDFDKCTEIVQNMGYDISEDIHSIDIHPKDSDEGIMDIHKYIILDSDDEKSVLDDIFKRSKFQNVFGVETLVPSNEDLFFILLVNMARNLKNRTSSSGILYNLFDCKFLINSKPDFNWNIVINNIKKTNTHTHICFALKFLDSIVHGIFGNNSFDMDKFSENEIRKYFILFIYQRYFLLNWKEKSHKMKICDIFSSYEFFKEYLNFKPRYFIFKLKMVKQNYYLAEKILKRYLNYANQ